MASSMPGSRLASWARADVEGTWEWTDGTPATYTEWGVGEPNDSGGEDCAEMYGSANAWNDLGCTAVKPYVCEKVVP